MSIINEKLEINNTCIKCDDCRKICPENSIFFNGKDYSLDNWSCSNCGLCQEICSSDSIKEFKENL